MSEQTIDLAAWLDGVQERNAAAWAEIAGLCDGSRRWTMRVPVDSARDSDELVAAALRDGEKAVAALRGVLALADSLDVDSCDPMPDERARLLYDTADRIRAAVAAAHTEEGR